MKYRKLDPVRLALVETLEKFGCDAPLSVTAALRTMEAAESTRAVEPERIYRKVGKTEIAVVVECPDCGALVLKSSTSLHDAWHSPEREGA